MACKPCSKCKLSQPLSEFYQDARRSDGVSSWCKACVRAYKRSYYASEQGKAKIQAYISQNKERRTAYNKQYLRKYRASGFKNKRKLEFCLYKGGKCLECGFVATQETIAAFDFHHLDESIKEYTLSDMLMLRRDKVFKELNKCILLCSNCHRILHHRQYRAKPID